MDKNAKLCYNRIRNQSKSKLMFTSKKEAHTDDHMGWKCL